MVWSDGSIQSEKEMIHIICSVVQIICLIMVTVCIISIGRSLRQIDKILNDNERRDNNE